LCGFALKTNSVSDNFLDDPRYVVADQPELLRLPESTFGEIRMAYKRKFDEIKANTYDYSKLKFFLKPLPGHKELVSSLPFHGGYIAFEATTRFPKAVIDDEDHPDVRAGYDWHSTCVGAVEDDDL
jgi:hypothetical protein